MAIASFKQKELEKFYYLDARSGIPVHLWDRLFQKLLLIDCANSIADLRIPRGNHLHPLQGNRSGQWAISVNGPWRLCFYFESGKASEIELVQYH